MAMRIGGAIRSHGVAVSRCRVVLAGESVFAVWRSLRRMEVVGRGTDGCRRSTGPSTHHQVSAVRPRLVIVKDVRGLGVRPTCSVVWPGEVSVVCITGVGRWCVVGHWLAVVEVEFVDGGCWSMESGRE